MVEDICKVSPVTLLPCQSLQLNLLSPFRSGSAGEVASGTAEWRRLLGPGPVGSAPQLKRRGAPQRVACFGISGHQLAGIRRPAAKMSKVRSYLRHGWFFPIKRRADTADLQIPFNIAVREKTTEPEHETRPGRGWHHSHALRRRGHRRTHRRSLLRPPHKSVVVRVGSRHVFDSWRVAVQRCYAICSRLEARDVAVLSRGDGTPVDWLRGLFCNL